jgi:hypothetical protein
MSGLLLLRRAILVFVLALAAVVLVPGASAPPTASAPTTESKSCARQGDALVAAGRRVHVVRRRLARRFERTRHELAACWTPTGRRTRLGIESQSAGAEVVIDMEVDLVDDRYVGVVRHEMAGAGEARTAAIYDARTGRELHNTSACLGQRGRFEGISEVVFFNSGGLAFTCNRLLVFRRASSQTAEQIEPFGTFVESLGISTGGGVLYWRVRTSPFGDIMATKSLTL